jgi:pilus assembly protein CpaB
VQVDSVSGAGLILPGDRVDVLVYLVNNSQNAISETSTRTVLQDIKVFAVNDVVELDKDGKDKTISAKTISLLVTPAQAAKVTLASEMGKIRLVMRGPEDNTHAEDAAAKPDELLGHSAFADRNKESSDQNKSEDKPSLLSLLNQIKIKPPVNQPSVNPVPEHTPTDTWTVRILQPGGINDVVLESDASPTADSDSSRHWRVTSTDVTSFGSGKSPADQAGKTKKAEKSVTPSANPADSPQTPTTNQPGPEPPIPAQS